MSKIPVIVTPYSFRGSLIRIEELPKYLKEFGYSSAIIADPNFHAHVIFHNVLTSHGIKPIHALTVGKKLLIARDREGYESLVAFHSKRTRKLKNVEVHDFSKFRPVMYFHRSDRRAYEVFRKILGLKPLEGDFSLEGGGDDPQVLGEFRDYDLFVEQKFLSPPPGWPNVDVKENEKERLKMELEMIRRKGFEGYFRTVEMIVEVAKRLGVRVGPGRGSAVGSLLAYKLGITKVNPLEYGLLFERFINEGRRELPDIDIDVEDVKRRDLIKALGGVFPFVSLVSTFSNLKEKALRKAMREVGVKDEKVFEKLFGLPARRSIHAAGVVVSAADMNLPFYMDEGIKVCEYDMESLKSIGVEKIDILGLSTLTLVSKLEEKTSLKVEDLPLDDADVYADISKGLTTGVFQLESREARRIASLVSPRSIVELSHVLALNRPGPLKANLHLEYAKRRLSGNWRSLEGLEDILDETLGLAIYQEQIMLMAVRLAGMSLSEADDLRKAVAKKDPERMKVIVERLRDGMKKKGYDDRFVEDMISFIEEFASYAFNKSHSVAYAHMSYYLAYFKRHHFPVFLLTFIDHTSDTFKIFQLVQEARFRGYEVKPPSVEKPLGDFDGRCITLPLHVVKGIGKDISLKVLEYGVRRVSDFVERVGGGALLEALIKAGAFDGVYPSRAEALIAFKKGDVARLFDKLKRKLGEREEELKPEDEIDRALLEDEAMGFPVTVPSYSSERPRIAEAVATGRRKVVKVLSQRGIVSDGISVLRARKSLPSGEIWIVVNAVGEIEAFSQGDVEIECERPLPDDKIPCEETLRRI